MSTRPIVLTKPAPIGWYAWDAVGQLYDSRINSAFGIPDTIQAVKVWKDQLTKGTRYSHVITGSRSTKRKWYVFPASGFAVVDYEGTLAEAQALYPTAIIKEGTFIDDATYMGIMNSKVYAAGW